VIVEPSEAGIPFRIPGLLCVGPSRKSAEPHALPKPARGRDRISPVELAYVVMRTRRDEKRVDWSEQRLEAETTDASDTTTFLR
jgi:hypothetical protein